MDHGFDAVVNGSGVEIVDRWGGSKTHLGINYQWYGITENQVTKFLGTLFDHIGYVRDAGLKLGIPEQHLREHDASKMGLVEFPYYVRNFHGDKADPDGFARAWLHHIHHNPHHWQYWIFSDGFTPRGSDVQNGCVEMPQEYAIEMIADWMGASMAYTGSWDMTDWLSKNTPKIRVHSETANYLTRVLDSMGYMDYCTFAVGGMVPA
jgi:hypothetical protein